MYCVLILTHKLTHSVHACSHIYTHIWTYTNTWVWTYTHYLAHSEKEKYQGTKDWPKVGTWESGGSGSGRALAQGRAAQAAYSLLARK